MRNRPIWNTVCLGALAFSMLPQAAAAESSEVVALVASNAKGAFSDIVRIFESTHKGVTVKASYLGGSAIGNIVDEEGPADVVLVGSSVLEKESQLVDTSLPVLRNKQVILVPKNNPANIKSLKDLANPGVKLAMGTPNSAVGKLASQVLQNAAIDYGFDFVRGSRNNTVVQAEKGSDVVDAVGKAANAAIAFQSDKNDAKFTVVPIEDKYNVISTYVVAVPKHAKNAAMGRELAQLVAGPEGQSILHRFNYMPPK